MGRIKVFLDTDVIISSLLSEKGASFAVIRNPKIEKVISQAVKKEVDEVTIRLNINVDKKEVLENVNIISLNLKKGKLSQIYSPYIFDLEDSHVIAGTHQSKSKFLLTHNTKHYHTEKIRNDLGIIVMKPGMFLQYLRTI